MIYEKEVRRDRRGPFEADTREHSRIHQSSKGRDKKVLSSLLRKHGVSLALHGHCHTNMEYSRKGIRFLIGGGSVLSSDPATLHLNMLRISDAVIETRHDQLTSAVLPLNQRVSRAEIPEVISHVAASSAIAAHETMRQRKGREHAREREEMFTTQTDS